MGVTIQVAGLCTVTVDSGEDNALETLGLTRNGADITFEGYFLNVPNDDNGGDDGPASDIQYLGETARIRLELTKFDNLIADKITPRERGATAGTIPTIGNLQFQGSKSHRLVIHTTTLPYNFPRVIFRAPVEINKGTKFSTLIIEAEAYKNGSNVFYSRVVV